LAAAIIDVAARGALRRDRIKGEPMRRGPAKPSAWRERLPYPLNSPWVWKIAGRYGLPVWFAALGVTHAISAIILPGYSAIDARIYWLAARLWITGGDPWSANVVVDGYAHHFAAPPVNVLPFVPFALLPEPVAATAVVGISWIAGYLIVRRLRLPLWWLLFPPMLEGLISGNPQILLTLLLVVGSAPLAAIASVLKIYALVPVALLGRWRSGLASALVLVAGVAATWTLWPEYIRRFGEISARLDRESFGGYSATYCPSSCSRRPSRSLPSCCSGGRREHGLPYQRCGLQARRTTRYLRFP
jgi:Glycosyltransferase family 87